MNFEQLNLVWLNIGQPNFKWPNFARLNIEKDSTYNDSTYNDSTLKRTQLRIWLNLESEEHKTTFRGLKNNAMALPDKIDFSAFSHLRKITSRNIVNSRIRLSSAAFAS